MNFKFKHKAKDVEVTLIYSVYLRRKKLYINGKEAILDKALKFKLNGDEFLIELYPEGFGYRGELVSDSCGRISSEVITKVKNKTPLLVIPFVIINFLVPIVSVEALTPWIIATIASYLTVKIGQNKELSVVKKLCIFTSISIIVWFLYYIYYGIVKPVGFKGGFLP